MLSKVCQQSAEDLAEAVGPPVSLWPSIYQATLPRIEFLWMAQLLMKTFNQTAEIKPTSEVQEKSQIYSVKINH